MERMYECMHSLTDSQQCGGSEAAVVRATGRWLYLLLPSMLLIDKEEKKTRQIKTTEQYPRTRNDNDKNKEKRDVGRR